MRRLENHIDRFFPRIDPSVFGSKPMPADLTQCWRPFLSISFPSNTTVARPWSCRLPRSPLNRWGNIEPFDDLRTQTSTDNTDLLSKSRVDVHMSRHGSIFGAVMGVLHLVLMIRKVGDRPLQFL